MTGSGEIKSRFSVNIARENPFKGSVLKGELRGLRRIRVGDYRVVYEVQDSILLVLVVRVAHRRDAYATR